MKKSQVWFFSWVQVRQRFRPSMGDVLGIFGKVDGISVGVEHNDRFPVTMASKLALR